MRLGILSLSKLDPLLSFIFCDFLPFSVSKHIGSQDPKYASLFLHESWKELLEMAEPSKIEVGDMVTRVCQYLASDSSENLINLPVAEAMVTYKEKSSDDESSQVFIPFVCDVRVGSVDPHLSGVPSLDLEDMVIGSPPAVEGGAKLTPPSSPHVGGSNDTGMLIQPGAKER